MVRMDAWLRRCRHGLLTTVVLLAAFATRPTVAAAGVGEALRAESDVAFLPVARDDDAAAATIPRHFAQDGTGFLWAGGAGGLFRWDGYEAASFVAGSRRPDGLPDHEITALARDAAGTLWVGTAGGLARFDAGRQLFVPVELGGPAGSAPPTINNIATDGARGLLVATDTGVFELPAGGSRARRLSGEAAEAVWRDATGAIWAGGPRGLAVLRDASARFEPVKLPGSGSAARSVTRLFTDATGALWIGTHDGAFVRAPDGSRITPVPIAGDALAAHEVMAMTEVRPGEVWIGTYGEGIVAARADGTERRIMADRGAARGLDSNVIFGLFRDRTGLIWVSTPFGLSHAIMAAHDAIVPLLDHQPARAGRLAVEQPTALLARREGDLWIGSEENGIEILDAEGRPAGQLPIQPVVAMAEAPDGRVFAGGRGGAYVISADGRTATRLAVPGRPATDTVWALLFADDRLWLGGEGGGIWVLRVPPAGGVSVDRRIAPTDETARISALLKLPDGTVAAATSGGLWLIGPAGLRVIRHHATAGAGLPSDHLATLALDRSDRLWVGSTDAGIAVLSRRDRPNPAAATIGVAEGLGNPDIDGMLPDRSGQMWISTDSGLAVVDPATLQVRPLSLADGVAISGYWTGSATRTADGDMLFGGTGGLTVLRPDLFGARSHAAPIAITRLLAGHKAVAATADRVTLPPDARNLTAEFASLDFADPRRSRYRYRLLGFDPGWIETDAAHRVAAYTNLRPGDYVLDIDGSDDTGRWSPDTLRIGVRVPPAWTETVTFRICIVLLVFALFAALTHLRTRFLRLHQRRLEREVEERTAALRASEARLERLAHLDALTSLPNRRDLDRQLHEACQNRRPSFALILIDIDGFKPVNDSHGHDAGDRLLVVIAERFRRCVRNIDLVARLGGDEFAILVANYTDSQAIEQICERVVATAAEPVTIGAHQVRVGASVGVALCPLHGLDGDAIFKCADLALYASKRAGRNRWRWFERPLAETA